MDIHQAEKNLERNKARFESQKDISKKNRELVTEFFNEYGKLNINKAATYDKYYHLFRRILTKFSKKDLDKWTKKDMFDFIDEVKKSNYAEKGRQDVFKLLKTFYFSWYEEHHKVSKELKEMLTFFRKYSYKPDKNKIEQPEVLSEDEVEAMINCATSARDKCFLMMLWETGARIGEMLSLQVKHVQNWEHGIKVTIPQSKTEKRTLPLIKTAPYVSEYLNTHPSRNDKNAPFWVMKNGGALEYDASRKLLKVAGIRAKIDKNIYPHLLRHSRATDCASKGWSEFRMRKWFGWSMTSDTPAVYVRRSGIDLEAEVERENGIEEVKDPKVDKLKPKACPVCKEVNPGTNEYCIRCYRPLDTDKVHDEFDNLANEASRNPEMMKKLLAFVSSMELDRLEEVGKALGKEKVEQVLEKKAKK